MKQPGRKTWALVWAWLLPAAFCVTGLAMAFYPMVFSGLRLVMTEPIDTRFNGYVLEHGYLWITGDPLHRSFWDPPMFHPATNTGAYSDVLLGVAPFYWAWRAAGIPPDTSLQLWMLTVAAVNFLLAYLMLWRGISLSPLAASVGAFIFAFGSSRLAQIGHQQLLAHFYTLASVYAIFGLFRAHADGRHWAARFWILVCFGGIVGQLWSGYYLGWFLAVGIGIGVLWGVALPAYRSTVLSVIRGHAPVILLGMGLSAYLLLPMASHYLQAAGTVPKRKYIDAYNTMPSWNLWCYMGAENWLYGWWAKRFGASVGAFEHEKQLGVGLVTLAAAAVGIWRERERPGVRILALTALTIILAGQVLSHERELTKLYFNHFPGAYSVRVVSRVGLLLLIPAAVGVAYFVQRAEVRWRPLLLVALVGVMLLEQGRVAASFDKAATRDRITTLALAVPADADSFLLTRGAGTDSGSSLDLDAMWVGLAIRKPTLNGYSGNQPMLWPLGRPGAQDPEQLPGLLAQWRRMTGTSHER
ncbi:MAG: hypothetical protein ACO1SX_09055, partial [Actinomycetota bacterium]